MFRLRQKLFDLFTKVLSTIEFEKILVYLVSGRPMDVTIPKQMKIFHPFGDIIHSFSFFY